MFKRFEGFKDFTMNTAKSGLSVGEKFAFWSYGKLRAWSKNWFTHIFLFLVVFLYTVLGAVLFVAIESPVEEKLHEDIRKNRYVLLKELMKLLKDPVLASNPKFWEGQGVNELLANYEPEVIAYYQKYGAPNSESKRWGFWNAVFFCGTIYTTIGEYALEIFIRLRASIYTVHSFFVLPLKSCGGILEWFLTL